MASVHDVAKFILAKKGEMTVMKLQKLLYYCQAWYLVWNEKPLFPEKIQAWANGPVVREVYDDHKGKFTISSWPEGSTSALSALDKDCILDVLDFYGDKTAQWLSDLTHREDPWLDARRGMSPGERGRRTITKGAMHEYYSSLRER